MSQAVQRAVSGAYTANLLGNIKSHLAGLQGYDVMALELIQNADDAKATEIIFDITDDGLLVHNSGRFTYCGDLGGSSCTLAGQDDYKCDFHRIVDVGSGGKLSRGENIGRFGIGFVSTYQVTDHPEIRSAGIRLTLHPEMGQWFIDTSDEFDSTSFFLPWAKDPSSETRLKLGISHVSSAHIEQLADDFCAVLRTSLLFLRHIQKAEVRRNGQLLLACDLDRGQDSDLIISFRPTDEVEQWRILRADAAENAKSLYASYSQLEQLNRSTDISIGLRTEPGLLGDGRLYAYLPTKQSTGLPLHINADFFPESNRKAIIFAGDQHQQAWNEMLIDVAATEVARDPEGLLKTLGHSQLWKTLNQAYELASGHADYPSCFVQFWKHLKETAAEAHIALAWDGSIQRPQNVFLPDSPFDNAQAETFSRVGGKLASEDLRKFRTVINQLGAPVLTLGRLVALLETTFAQVENGTTVDENELEQFYTPLWRIIDDILPKPEKMIPSMHSGPIKRLKKLRFIVTEDLFVVAIDQASIAPSVLDAGRIAELLPTLAIASHRLSVLPRVVQLVDKLNLDIVVSHINLLHKTEPLENIISIEDKDLRDLYSLFATLDGLESAEDRTYKNLRALPIWKSSHGLVNTSQTLLPGNFEDPTGLAHLLDTSILTESVKSFLSTKLEVHTQTIETFVTTILPSFFDDEGPVDTSKYPTLIRELASHPELLDVNEIRFLLGNTPIVPTQDGGWSCPTQTYRRTDKLVKSLGDSPHLWVDRNRIPDNKSTNSFIDNLGIRRSPLAEHLVERMLSLASNYSPTDETRRASAEAFYTLCSKYDAWKNESFFKNAIGRLRDVECFPADGDTEMWHTADSLYAPYRPDAFRSQADILSFTDVRRLERKLLEELGVATEPGTTLVIGHLKHCISTCTPPSFLVYQILNERAADESDLLSAEFSESEFMYVEDQKRFVRPSQLYWTRQQLSHYAYTIPNNYRALKPLFDAIGVKDTPDAKDFVEILLDVVGEHYEQSKALAGAEHDIYLVCLKTLATALVNDDLECSDLQRLQQAPSVVNLFQQFRFPDEILIQDSEWHAGFFGGELDQALCKPDPELQPLLQELGVRLLSESAQVELELADGRGQDESVIAQKLQERAEIIIRSLHDKPGLVRRKIRVALSKLTAVSCDVVHIRASVNIGEQQADAPPASAQAFYDKAEQQLILARPINDRSWAYILNALFHQLMPETPGGEISLLTMGIRPLIAMTTDEAHNYLDDAGVPHIEAETKHSYDLTSPELNDVGATTEQPSDDKNAATSATSAPPDGSKSDIDGEYSQQSADSEAQPRTARVQQDDPNEDASQSHEDSSRKPNAAARVGSISSRSNGRGSSKATGSRAKHKQQWDRRLLSYVRPKPVNGSGIDEQNDVSEHNLAVEAVARNAVCNYEEQRGRVATQMPQTHPGYDIVSNDPATGEERLIEVKGINGEWNQTGVGLSSLQFSNAQDFGNRYWLYVVEFVSDDENIRVHPIRSPATQVTAFMFDGNWRQAVTEEQADPSAFFIVGARVHHKTMGAGNIQDVIAHGNTKLLTILFDGKSTATPNVPLNVYQMSVVEQSNDID